MRRPEAGYPVVLHMWATLVAMTLRGGEIPACPHAPRAKKVSKNWRVDIGTFHRQDSKNGPVAQMRRHTHFASR